MPRDLGIATRIRAKGVSVVEVDGWRGRGSDTFHPKGSVDHHTAGSIHGNCPSLGICINGRPATRTSKALPGPLSQVLQARDNTAYVIAAGRANHAGQGSWRGLYGNSSVFGLERENIGNISEVWRPDQTMTAAKIHAALIEPYASAEYVCEHKEWAPGRKIDAHTIMGAAMRILVSKYLYTSELTPEAEMAIEQALNTLVNEVQALRTDVSAMRATLGKMGLDNGRVKKALEIPDQASWESVESIVDKLAEKVAAG